MSGLCANLGNSGFRLGRSAARKHLPGQSVSQSVRSLVG